MHYGNPAAMYVQPNYHKACLPVTEGLVTTGSIQALVHVCIPYFLFYYKAGWLCNFQYIHTQILVYSSNSVNSVFDSTLYW